MIAIRERAADAEDRAVPGRTESWDERFDRRGMHYVAQAVLGLAVIAFIASWAAAIWSIMRLRLAIRRDGRPSLTIIQLFDTRSTVGYPEARRFMRAMQVGVVSECIGLAIGLASEILQ